MHRLLASLLIGLATAAVAHAAETRRFAVIVASNDGGEGTEPLYYAHEDARKIHEILTRVGGVRPSDARLILEGSADEVLRAIDALEARARQAKARGARTLFILYYSGHAKDGALRLGDSRLPLDLLRARLKSLDADVRIGVLDSCRSGLVNRTKGARRAPAFEVDTGAPGDARGMVLLTSSSADEDSQESDHLGGSYFTHHFATGLLGGADRSGEGRITLSEAYAYAYERTVAATASTSAGPQHPTFSYDLEGNGDVVLTDVSSRREGIVLPAEAPDGIYYLVTPEGRVAAEVLKSGPEPRRIALAPGDYTVKRRLPDRLRIGEIRVPVGRLITLQEAGLRDAPFADDPVKGSGRAARGGGWRVAGTGGYRAFFQAPELGEIFPSTLLAGAELEQRGLFGPGWILLLEVVVGQTRSEAIVEGTSFPYGATSLSVGSGLVREWRFGIVRPAAGVELSWLYLRRAFDDETLPAQDFSTFSPGLVGGLRLSLGRGFFAGLRGRLHYLHYAVDQDLSLGYAVFSLSFGYDGGER
ncbi:MAG: caspase family protein [Deltaproteobacteria bacterium]|nr:MAG: caspase family protein [Deltaproteobacteria bacterium]